MATDPEKHEILCLMDDTEELLREELSRDRPEEMVHLKRETKWLGGNSLRRLIAGVEQNQDGVLQWSKAVVDQGEGGDGVEAIKIFLDSRSAIQSIGGTKETELIRSIRSLVEELTAANVRVRIAWTRGHAGDPENEAPDLAASIGRRREAGNVRICSVPAPCDFTAREIRQTAEVELEER
ncbi:hypothetical protein FOZ63_025413 [Perkinsus olseni]|uniref:RNase H type-1 domain-containing protein n=1 Tax=Perkinsus olseni TaxID=32597 RepID=A0A7J6TSX7_PEROL|nr:hypothetical protein FOZ63_025413 [Perkinsus olseni]